MEQRGISIKDKKDQQRVEHGKILKISNNEKKQ